MFGRAIRLIAKEWANHVRIIGSCLAVACLLLLSASENLVAQPKKKPSVTARKSAPQEEAASGERSSKAPKKSRKRKDKDKNSVAGVANYLSPNFLVHTDLPDDRAEELLDRLETMLDLISKYWNRPPSGVIEMFVVNDLKTWPPGAIPDEGLESIAGGAGVTDMAKEISFEYRQFLKNLEPGYRADLCSWDWKAKFKLVKSGAVVQAKIDAGKGWQPSRLILSEGQEYEYSVGGTWTVAKDGPPVDADGDAQGRGQLIGALLSDENRDYALGEPFELGKFGSVLAPGSGSLYLRCREDWAALADNRGIVTVKLKLKNKGPPLSPPKSDDERKKTTAKTKSDDTKKPNENSVEEAP